MKYVYQKNKTVSYGYLITCLFLLVIVILFSGNVCAEGDEAFFIDENGNIGIGKEPEQGIALDVNGTAKAREIESAGTVKAKKFEGDASVLTVKGKSIELFLVPKGAIIAWHPIQQNPHTKEIKVPEGWAICDGENGTPDLRKKFIMGSENFIENSGGSAQHDHGGKVEKGGPAKKVAAVKGLVSASTHASQLNHDHKINADSNLPPYCSLTFIMKLY